MRDAERSYYVYALKDPRTNPAKPFYIGKGTGIRAWEHDLHADETPKGQRITEIRASGFEIVETKLVESLTEFEALKLEAELITAFGTLTTGGILTNSVVPGGLGKGLRGRNLVIPSGAIEKAQFGLKLLKEAVFELALANKVGVTNSDLVHSLGLQSDYKGGSKDYLTWSLLGILMREGKLKRVEKKKHQAQTR